MSRVQIINEVNTGNPSETHQWELCFQWCRYIYDKGGSERGFRFIWRRPDGSLQPARGQARIISIEQAKELMDRAREAGWGSNVGD